MVTFSCFAFKPESEILYNKTVEPQGALNRMKKLRGLK
jgi:hypothetical protein